MLRRATVLLGLLYVVLLIPAPEPSPKRNTGQQPFAWNQDEFWAELEARFVKARVASCDSLAESTTGALAQISKALDEISQRPLSPDDGQLAALETNLFQLAPLIAACPARLVDFISLANRTRSEVKRQSRSWDMNSAATRRRVYRLLFGTRMALEEILLQVPPGAAGTELVLGDDTPSQTPSVAVRGVRLHSGDILLSRGGAPTSSLIARGNDYPGSFSHVALAHVDASTGRASMIESHIEGGVAITPIEDYLADKKLRILLLRLRPDLSPLKADPMLPHRAATEALAEARRRHIPYDFTMDHRHHEAQFCSEVAAAAYERTGVTLWMGLSWISSPTVSAWLGSLGVRHFETQEPSDLEYDPQLSVVAEWRDRATLLKAHADDAVTDVMLEEAKPGRPLDYNRLALPAARLAKAWSFVLNQFGKTGPIPEGMSAATALRVKKFRNDHDARAERLLVQAAEFQKSRGYAPTYRELTRLARATNRNAEKQP
jgi:hypothetical protein